MVTEDHGKGDLSSTAYMLKDLRSYTTAKGRHAASLNTSLSLFDQSMQLVIYLILCCRLAAFPLSLRVEVLSMEEIRMLASAETLNDLYANEHISTMLRHHAWAISHKES